MFPLLFFYYEYKCPNTIEKVMTAVLTFLLSNYALFLLYSENLLKSRALNSLISQAYAALHPPRTWSYKSVQPLLLMPWLILENKREVFNLSKPYSWYKFASKGKYLLKNNPITLTGKWGVCWKLILSTPEKKRLTSSSSKSLLSSRPGHASICSQQHRRDW